MTAKGFGIQDPRVGAVHFANAARAQLTNASTRHLHCGTGCILICHLEGAVNLIAILLHQIFKAARIAGRCDEAIARCEHSFSDVGPNRLRCRLPTRLLDLFSFPRSPSKPNPQGRAKH